MKKTIFYFSIILLILSSCNSINKTINEEAVILESLTNTYLFRGSQKKVTGTIVSNFVNMGQNITRKLTTIDGVIQKNQRYYENGTLYGETSYKNGLKEGLASFYFPNGNIWSIGYFKNGLIDSIYTRYFEDGVIYIKENFKNDSLNGVQLEYNYSGVQVKETIYDMGKEIKSYDFDYDGNKLIPAIECLKLLTYKTGFYESVNYNHNQILYQPIVIMKWKNISDKPLDKNIKMTGVFISKGEEWSNESSHLQYSQDAPLQSNITRQIFIKSSVGYTSAYGIFNGNVSCQISIDGKVFKTIKISNRLLESNRM